MELSQLTAVSPLDGRYWNSASAVSDMFSELALFRYRALVEIEYFIALCDTVPQMAAFPRDQFEVLRQAYIAFSQTDAAAVKAIEKVTNHDVKAMEYWIKEKIFDAHGLQQWREFVHFGLTSQDVNSTSIALSIRDAVVNVYFPELRSLAARIRDMGVQWKDIPMLARTHGQPASPTRVGKELLVFAERLEDQLEALRALRFDCKFGGATGGMNAHVAAYPAINWPAFADAFVSRLPGLPPRGTQQAPPLPPMRRQRYTTQIEHYDGICAVFDVMRRSNTILLDFSRDMWAYISTDYFKLKVIAGEVGSSAMPHKVNPIDFENGEGNIGVANALFEHFCAKLPVSRLQRDLSDSTVTRNLGVAVAHSVVAMRSIGRGIGKVVLDETRIAHDLDSHWEVVAEAVQTVLRRAGHPKPYEVLKAATRGAAVTRESIVALVESLEGVGPEVKEEVLALSPSSFIGVCPDPTGAFPNIDKVSFC